MKALSDAIISNDMMICQLKDAKQRNLKRNLIMPKRYIISSLVKLSLGCRYFLSSSLQLLLLLVAVTCDSLVEGLLKLKEIVSQLQQRNW